MHIVKAKIDAGMEVEVPCAKGIEIFGPDKDGIANLVVRGAGSVQQAAEKSGRLLSCFFLNRARIISCQEI